ncbi:MAG: FUSC family protein [Solirubrobacteraceae bacterium]
MERRSVAVRSAPVEVGADAEAQPRTGGRRAAASWIPARSLPALLRAIRATVVLVGLFAITDLVIGNVQMATFAAFGTFATLVLSSFAGTRRDKLLAHAALALAGSVLLTIGTVVSYSAALAAVVTVPVTFIVFFAGIAGPNAASGSTGALLAYVLPAASPGTAAMIPDRLAGWWLASVAGTAAVLALSPRSAGDALRRAVSKMADALGEELERALRGGGDGDREAGLSSLIAAKHELLASFDSTPYRPLGLAAPDEALAKVVELLEWGVSLVTDAVREHPDLGSAPVVDRELLAAAAAALRDTASLFAGAGGGADLALLEARREASLAAVRSLQPSGSDFQREAQISFHAQAIAVATLAIATDALVAERRIDPRRLTEGAHARVARSSQRVSALAAAAVRHASVRSVWFINSLRVSLALGVAVAVADLSSVQHGFWVVLGTLSVLRTNAASTRATALQALTGTVIGFVIGGALLVLIGTSTAALWTALPIAVFVAAYAPGTAPFALGQAAFTVTVALLFNLIAPVGWEVGLVRVEDVALGCAVSVVFGVMFWPRGLAGVVGDDLADAFRSGAAFLAQAVAWTTGLDGREPNSEGSAAAAGLRLDDALRGFLTERGSKRMEKTELWRLVGGTLRLRLTAHAVADLPQDPIALAADRGAIRRRTDTLTAWYAQLAELVDRPSGRAPIAIQPPTFGAEDVVSASSGSQYGVWLCEHLDHLAEHLGELVHPAERVAELRRAPWWR